MVDRLRIVHVVPAASAACRALAGPQLLTLGRVAGLAVEHVVVAATFSAGTSFAIDAFTSAAGGVVLRCGPSDLARCVRSPAPHIVQCWGCVLESTAFSDSHHTRVVFDIAGDGDSFVVPRCDVPGAWDVPSSGMIVTECSSRFAATRDSGTAALRCVIPSRLDACGVVSALRSATRDLMKLDEGQCGLLVLPPAHAVTDGFTAVWAALLVAQIQPHIRIMIPALGADGDRLRALVRSTKFDHLLTPVESVSDWMRLMAAADIGIQLHSPLSGANGIAEMLSIGRRVVVLDEAAPRELSAASPGAYFAGERQPKAVAAALLRAVDDWGKSATVEVQQRRDLVSEYEQLYADLLDEKVSPSNGVRADRASPPDAP